MANARAATPRRDYSEAIATFNPMAIRKFKPTTPGQRNKAISAFDEITCTKPEKSLLEPIRKSGGRNNTGKMTMRYIGGGHKRMYRIIDFRRDKDNCPATVRTIVCRRREEIHHRSRRYPRRPDHHVRSRRGSRARQRSPSLRDSSGNCHPQHRASSRSGCRYGPQRRNIRSAHRT